MRRILVRDEQERLPREQGGTPWQEIANQLAAEVDALKEERHANDVAMRTMSQDVVRKADENLQLGNKLLAAERALLEFRQEHQEGVDVQAVVEPEDQATVA